MKYMVIEVDSSEITCMQFYDMTTIPLHAWTICSVSKPGDAAFLWYDIPVVMLARRSLILTQSSSGLT